VIGLDTNVLVRYIMQDDQKQSPVAAKLIESLSTDVPGFVTLVSVVELVWVLDSCYGLERQQLSDAVEGLLRTQEVIIESAETVWKAVRSFRSSAADFADCLIERLAASAGCDKTVTFDRLAAKNCGMTLLQQ
jgi:predicted nucleic-acid-binding protein